MSKITIDPNLKGEELTKFLVENKAQLIAQKKSILKKCDAISSAPEYYHLKDGKATKAAVSEITDDVSKVRVKVVANAALFIDSHMDLLLPDCWKKSIKERKGLIPHIHDHVHEIDAELGDVVNIYTQDVALNELGWAGSGSTQALIFETDIIKSYNEKAFNKYKAGKIKQHSIALWYIKIELAVNDENSEKEYDFWKKYYDQVINKELADEKGYFWVVPEIMLIENSAVLFGANRFTPTLDVKTDTTTQPPSGTEEEPSIESFSIKNLLQIF